MRLVLFADLHLDAAFSWARPETARRRRQALRDTLGNVLALADEVDADAILCAGDLYEHDRFTPDTREFVRRSLGETGRRVLIAPGNHDWYGRESLYAQVSWPAGVHVFHEERLVAFELEAGLTLWGAAFGGPTRGTGFLDDGFAVDRAGVHLALFHGSVRGGLPAEVTGKQPHAPFEPEQIERAGLHHALVGHFHEPREEPRFTYPGNPDPLTFGETGVRGAVIVEVAPSGEIRREWRRVAVSRVHDRTLDITGCSSSQEIRERASGLLDGLSGAVRLTLTGDLEPDVDLDAGALREGLGQDLEELVIRTSRLRAGYDLEAIRAEPTVRGHFVRDVEAAEDLDDDARRRVLTTGLRALDGRDDLEVP